MRYQGSVISATPPTITPAVGSNPGGTAPGIWTLEQQQIARGNSLWPRTTGESVYTTTGTYSWVCPAGITSVSVVCIGTTDTWNDGPISYGKGGGGLGYKNGISVTPGSSYTVVVGDKDGDTDSYFISKATVKGGGGNSGTGGNYVGDGGGNGGNGGGYYGGGGGAGGYSGNGGAGGPQTAGGSAGSGGGGGGGAGLGTASGFAGGGGGVGLYGEGTSGAGGVYSTTPNDPLGGGRGGSGGENGPDNNTGGAYGGGK